MWKTLRKKSHSDWLNWEKWAAGIFEQKNLKKYYFWHLSHPIFKTKYWNSSSFHLFFPFFIKRPPTPWLEYKGHKISPPRRGPRCYGLITVCPRTSRFDQSGGLFRNCTAAIFCSYHYPFLPRHRDQCSVTSGVRPRWITEKWKAQKWRNLDMQNKSRDNQIQRLVPVLC